MLLPVIKEGIKLLIILFMLFYFMLGALFMLLFDEYVWENELYQSILQRTNIYVTALISIIIFPIIFVNIIWHNI
jgi:hypothetical protein|nr:MAG TPA: hypothetical protein [Caudoviricetes sp.]